jgi:hypothetical protein
MPEFSPNLILEELKLAALGVVEIQNLTQPKIQA